MTCLHCKTLKDDNDRRQVEIGRALRVHLYAHRKTPAEDWPDEALDRRAFLMQCDRDARRDAKVLQETAWTCTANRWRHCANPFCLGFVPSDDALRGERDCVACRPGSKADPTPATTVTAPPAPRLKARRKRVKRKI
jgi:hypothetical protein